MDPVKAVVEAVRGPAAAGLYTHAYVAYGRLSEPMPDFEHAHLPDGRDVFDLASLTKALVTTPLVFAAFQTGRLSPESTIGSWLGERASVLAPRLRGLTLRALLRHESGLPAWRNFWICHLGVGATGTADGAGDRRTRLIEGLNRAASELPEAGGPTPSAVYSDVGFLLLGLALEFAHGTDLAVQFQDFCARELNTDSGALPLAYGAESGWTPPLGDRAVPSANCALRGRLLTGEVHDENCASLGGVTAHAGLFGTGGAVARYLGLLARSSPGRRLLQDNAREMELNERTAQREALLGWRQGADPSAEVFGTPLGHCMGHLGFVGTAFWVCPERQDYAIFLTNRVISGRTRSSSGLGIAAVRREVFQSLARLRR